MSLNRDLAAATEELNLVRADVDEIEQRLRAGDVVPFDDYFLAIMDLNLALDRMDALIGRTPWPLWMLWFFGYTLLGWLMFISVEEGFVFGVVIPIIGFIILTQHVVDFLDKMRVLRSAALRRLNERNQPDAGPSAEGTV